MRCGDDSHDVNQGDFGKLILIFECFFVSSGDSSIVVLGSRQLEVGFMKK